MLFFVVVVAVVVVVKSLWAHLHVVGNQPSLPTPFFF